MRLTGLHNQKPRPRRTTPGGLSKGDKILFMTSFPQRITNQPSPYLSRFSVLTMGSTLRIFSPGRKEGLNMKSRNKTRDPIGFLGIDHASCGKKSFRISSFDKKKRLSIHRIECNWGRSLGYQQIGVFRKKCLSRMDRPRHQKNFKIPRRGKAPRTVPPQPDKKTFISIRAGLKKTSIRSRFGVPLCTPAENNGKTGNIIIENSDELSRH